VSGLTSQEFLCALRGFSSRTLRFKLLHFAVKGVENKAFLTAKIAKLARSSQREPSRSREEENGALPPVSRRAPLLKVQQIVCEDVPICLNYSAPRRPSTIAPQVTV
jgi:hypothetical protein